MYRNGGRVPDKHYMRRKGKDAVNGDEYFRKKAESVAKRHKLIDEGAPPPNVASVVKQHIAPRPAHDTPNNGTEHFRKKAESVAKRQKLLSLDASEALAPPSPPVLSPLPSPPPPPIFALPSPAFIPWTERYRPKKVDEVVGNTQAKSRLVAWVNGAPNVCLLSGPVGSGKTSLAHAVLSDSGHVVVDVRAKPDDFTALLDDLVHTPPLKPVGVVVDEAENLPATHRTFMVKLLTKRTPQVHVLIVCTDANDRALKSVIKLCSTHVRMFAPCDVDVRALITRLCAKTSITLPDARVPELVQCVRGDMRRLVTTLWEIKQRANTTTSGADVRFYNPFDAANTVLRTRDVEEGVTAARSDRMLVRLMTAKQLPHVVDNLESLVARMELMSCADVMEAHTSALEHALWVHVAATSRTTAHLRKHLRVPKVQFPAAELSMHSKRESNRAAIKNVVNAFRRASTTHNPAPEFIEIVRERMQSDTQVYTRVCSETSKQDVKRVCDLKFK